MEQLPYQCSHNGVVGFARRHAVANSHGRYLGVGVVLGATPFGFLWRLGKFRFRGHRPSRDGTKVFFNFSKGLLGFYVAGDGYHGIIGSVIVFVKILNVLDLGCVQIVKVAIEVV